MCQHEFYSGTVYNDCEDCNDTNFNVGDRVIWHDVEATIIKITEYDDVVISLSSSVPITTRKVFLSKA